MKPYEIVWHPKARGDLPDLYNWIADEAGPDTALEYTSKIEALTAKLGHFPDRGTPRHDLVPHMRTIPYRRHTVIAYRVRDEDVEILAIVHCGRDLAGVFEKE